MKKIQIKFRGTFNELVNTIRGLGFECVSETEGDNMCTVISEEGGIFNWWKSTSTLQFQGKNFEDNRMKFISEFGTDHRVSGQEEKEEGKGKRDTLCWRILEGGVENISQQEDGGAPVLWVQSAAVNYLRSLKWPTNLSKEKNLSKVFYLISTINILIWTRRKSGESSDGEFVPLSSKLLQHVMGHEYAKIMEFLKLVDFIEVFTRKGRESYSTGGDGRKGACKKYRIDPSFIKGTFVPIVITGPDAFPRRILEAIEEARTQPLESPSHELIRKNTFRLKFSDPAEVVNVLEVLGKSDDAIQSQMYNIRSISRPSRVKGENGSSFKTDAYGRIYSSFSNLFREARPFLRLDGHPLVCLDLHASHWFHALMLWGDQGSRDFGVLSEELTKGDLYQALSDTGHHLPVRAGRWDCGAHQSGRRRRIEVGEAKKTKDALDVFKKDLGTFVRFYEFMSQIVDYDDKDLERLSLYARNLRPLLRESFEDDEVIDLSNIELSHYRLSKLRQQDLVMEGEEGDFGLHATESVGSGRSKDRKEEPLSLIIDRLNELFITEGLTEETS